MRSKANTAVTAQPGGARIRGGTKPRRSLPDQWAWVLMLVPGIVLALIFKYGPMFGVVMAFQDFNPVKGFFHSEWVGLKNFIYVLQMPSVAGVIRNTVLIAVAKIVLSILVPLILALLINEVRSRRLSKFVQTSVFLPFFLSWIILGGILLELFSLDGPVNRILQALGGTGISFFTSNKWYPVLTVASDVWKGMGYNMIIFSAAILGISPELYEAAMIDGAGRWQQTLHVTLPGIMPTVILLSILALGNVLNAGFEQILVTYNPVVYESGDIIDTFVYRMGIFDRQYSPAAAVELFKSVISFILVGFSYWFAGKVSDYRVF